MCVGDGGVAQFEAFLRFLRRFLHGIELLPIDAHTFFGNGEREIVLCGAQNQALFGTLPLQRAQVGRAVELALLGVALGVVERLRGDKGKTRGGAPGHGSAETHVGRLPKAGRTELRAACVGFVAGNPRCAGKMKVGAPQCVRLLAQGLRGFMGGAGDGVFFVVRSGRLPGFQQPRGHRCARQTMQDQRQQGGQESVNGTRFHHGFSPCWWTGWEAGRALAECSGAVMVSCRF